MARLTYRIPANDPAATVPSHATNTRVPTSGKRFTKSQCSGWSTRRTMPNCRWRYIAPIVGKASACFVATRYTIDACDAAWRRRMATKLELLELRRPQKPRASPSPNSR